MKLLINYANDRFRKSQMLNSKTGMKVGLFDEVISYSPEDIDSEFYEWNRIILSQQKGNGYWLWKPYFIHKTLNMLNHGDFLFYCDSDSYFKSAITSLINISRTSGQDLLIFELQAYERAWSKRDAFKLMECDSPKYTNSKQRLGGFSLWRKSEFTINFVNQYLSYAQDERLITDLENQCGDPNYPEFREHRHDQSILSLLTKKYEQNAYRDPSQWGNGVHQYYKTSNYDQLVELVIN